MSDSISLNLVQLESDTTKACEKYFKPLGKGTVVSAKIPLSQGKEGYLHFEQIRTLPVATNSFVLQLSPCKSTFCTERKIDTNRLFGQVPYGHPLPLRHLPREKGTEITAIYYGDADGDGRNDILVKLANGGSLLFLQPGLDELLAPKANYCSSPGSSIDLAYPR